MPVIIGAGAAGLFAALAAVRENKKTVIYEKMSRPGIKLSLAGGGRCNLSNGNDLLTGLHSTRFLRPALSALDNTSLRELLQDIGVATKVDEVGRVYPRDMNGRELADYLARHLQDQGVEIFYNSALTDFTCDAGILSDVSINGKSIPCQQAILACGGNTWPKTGSDGAALGILEQAGHKIEPLLPGLAPIKTRESWPVQLKGLSLRAVKAMVTGNDKKLDEFQGDILFTHFGLSGPVILDVSHAAAKARHECKQTHITIDFLPDLTTQQIGAVLEQQRQKTVTNALAGILPAQLAKALGSEDYVKGLAPSTLDSIARRIKASKLEVVDVLGKNHAMVSQGGVSLKEVNPRTMESKLIQGLHITGEMLAYHGRTGGYNLHGAFATGWLAGQN